MVLSRLEYRRR